MDAVGVIGLGLMGGALSERFRAAGLRVVGFDPRAECRDRLASIGGESVASARDVFHQTPTVVFSLPNSDATRSVVVEAGELVRGATIIDTTTGEPDAAEEVGARLGDAGCDYLDATLTGSSAQARAGELVVTAGGRAEVFARAEPLFRLFAARWFHVGAWGSGARTKLVVNLVLGLNRAALAEGLAFARCCGLDLPAVLEILQSGAAYSRAMDAKGRKMIDGDYVPQAKLSQHLKDVRLMRSEGEKVGAALPLSALHESLLAQLDGRGMGEWDNSAVFRAFDGEPRMPYRTLGRTGLTVSAVAFGAGPVSGLMTGSEGLPQFATVRRALERGVNWFDTAPGYGDGASETALGRVLAELGAADRVHIATKVRVHPGALDNPTDYVRQSVEESLQRLRVPRVTLLQLHNGVTRARGDEPAAIMPADALRVAGAMLKVRDAGLVRHIGLTGTGHPDAMREVVRSGAFDTIQVPFNALNPTAGTSAPLDGETDYGNVIAECAAQRMGVFAIRVFAGGALLNQPPSAHTLKTPYFPLELYERDAERARALRERILGRLTPAEFAVRFVLSHPAVTSAIIGFGSPHHVDEVARARLDDPLPPDLLSSFG